MKDRKLWVYDLEQFPNFHSGYFINPDTEEHKFFVIHKARDDRKAYYDFLTKEVKGLIGFNNINYDHKLLNTFLEHPWEFDLIRRLMRKSRMIIGGDAKWEKQKIPQLDLFKIHHYNNKARRTSLKWIEFYLRMEDVMDLPLHPESPVEEYQFKDIEYYNKNDVLATLEFYKYTIKQGMIDLRRNITSQFKFNAMNLNDVAIGERINAIYYSQFSGLHYSEFKDSRTYRKVIKMSDCLPSYTNFYTKIMNNVVNDLKTKTIESTKGGMEYTIKLGNTIYSLKKGGLHSHDKDKYLKPNDDQILCEMDVGSMYPSIIIENNIYPKHLGEEWLKGYRFIRDDRIKAKHSGDKTKADSYKLALNGGGFGKTNSEFSWMYDPLTSYELL